MLLLVNTSGNQCVLPIPANVNLITLTLLRRVYPFKRTRMLVHLQLQEFLLEKHVKLYSHHLDNAQKQLNECTVSGIKYSTNAYRCMSELRNRKVVMRMGVSLLLPCFRAAISPERSCWHLDRHFHPFPCYNLK